MTTTCGWRDPFAPRESAARQAVRFGLVVAVHLALIAAVVGLAADPALRAATQDLMVRLIEAPPPVVAPAPPRPQPAPQTRTRRRPVPPPPIMAAAAAEPAAASFAVAPPPPVAPQPPPLQAVPPAPPAPPVATAARFDADYLQNPKPVYPTFSRRQGEEGKVQLRVRVGADGSALEVEIEQSSGYARLDHAARTAVAQWRFVPARRGGAAIASWVGVPIVFALEH